MKKLLAFLIIAGLMILPVQAAPQRAILVDSQERPLGTSSNPLKVSGSIGSWTTSGNDQYSSNSGNVGIGTTTPGQKLDVQGTIRAFVVQTSGNGTDSGITISSQSSTPTTPSTGQGMFWIKSDKHPHMVDDAGTDTDIFSASSPFTTVGSDIYKASGNIGIGTTTITTYRFMNWGTGAFGTGSVGTNGARTFVSGVNFNSTLDLNLFGGNVFYNGTTRTRRESTLGGWYNAMNTNTTDAPASYFIGYINVAGTDSGGIFQIDGGATANTLRINGSNIGIGTTVPSAMLDLGVNGRFKVSSAGVITSVGNVGITTTAPTTCGCKQFTNGLCTTVGTCT